VSDRVLEVSGLVVSFPGEHGRKPVVDRVDLALDAGETLALVGESGCGKSITALSLLRLVPKPGRIESGSISIGGQDVRALPIAELRRVRGREAAMIFQEPATSLNPVLTAGSQVVEAIRLHERIGESEARRRAQGLFERVGIPDPGARLDTYPHQLSGGMKQRVMIAIALAARPKLLIADEPTTALDVTIQAQILALLRDLQRETGMAVLLITHDHGIVNEIADRVAVMYAGRLVEEGSRESVLGAARHPYTQGLQRSIPALAPHGARLPEIPGGVPTAGAWPPGCRFHPRCPRCFEPCPVIDPEWTELRLGQRARCHAVARDEQAP
jgi:oligopeptide/dipeptide ABC transporter ATP-binding protein